MSDKILRVVQVGTHHDHAPAPISTFDHMEGFELLGIINDTDEPGDSMHPMFNEPHADNVPEYITWENLERILKKLSGRSDIFYGTNKEVLL